MIFQIYGLENELKLNSGINNIYCLNNAFYNKLVFELFNGNTSFDIFDDKFQKQDIEKLCTLVYNPNNVNLSDKKIISALYKQLSNSFTDDIELHTKILDKLEEIFSLIKDREYDFPLSMEINENLTDLFKYFNVQIDVKAKSAVENLYFLIEVYSRFFHGQILCFFELSNYFLQDDFLEFNKFCIYHNMQVLNFERKIPFSNSCRSIIINEDFSDELQN